ncbi:MAG: hypothetical protein PF693_00065 [Spirochaetia bacterium]|jgi:rubrerythrin|nr:hypothetical protein [Spirochaetia bacterium]
MIKIELKELFTLSIEWTVKISKFYADFRDNCDDVSFRKLLTTMIDQERQYTEYYKDNLAKLNIESDFVFNDSGLIDLNDSFEDIPDVKEMSKIDFLKNAVHFQEISIQTCNFLGELSKTNRGKQIFKELADEESRHMYIFKDHLELEELF